LTFDKQNLQFGRVKGAFDVEKTCN